MTATGCAASNPSRLESQIRNPHPVVARLVQKPSLLEVNNAERRRALLILHTIVRLAEARGWTVDWASAADTQSKKTSTRDLMSIDAGNRPVTIRIRMKQVRVPHVPTESEQRWRYGRKWDYSPGDAMRLEVRDDYQVSYFDDGQRKRIEDHLDRILARIKKYTDEEVEREVKRLAQLRGSEARRLESERQRERVEHYQQWSDAVSQLLSDVEVHEKQKRLLDRVERLAAMPEPHWRLDTETFLAWARRHLQESDPMRHVRLPSGHPPEMTFSEFRAACESG